MFIAILLLCFVGGIHYDDQLNDLCELSTLLSLLRSSGLWLHGMDYCSCRISGLTDTPTNGFILIMQR